MSGNSLLYAKDVFSFETRVDGPAPKSHNHYHETFEVYYLQKGTCWYFIDKKSYHLSAGDIALIPAGVIHKTSYDTPISSRSIFFCDDSFIPDSARELMRQIPYFAKTSATAPVVDDLFSRIQAEFKNPDDYSMDVIRTKAAELFLLIAREHKKPHEEKPESPIVEKAVAYICKHYTESVTLQAVAEYCFVSREHLSRIFKKATGFGFNEYVTVYRMQKAHAMLAKYPKIKVSQVAIQCGFNDSNYFSKQYKKMYGIAPTKIKRGE